VRYGAVRVLKGRHVGKIGYDDHKGDKAVVYFAEPLSSGHVLIRKDWRPRSAPRRAPSAPSPHGSP